VTNDICSHGGLRRKCEPCDLAEELKECREALLKMETENERCLGEIERLRAALSKMSIPLLGRYADEIEKQGGERVSFFLSIEFIRELQALELGPAAEPSAGNPMMSCGPDVGDYTVQCRCGWRGKVSELKPAKDFTKVCPNCSSLFKPL
jgi:hypothetical protein